MDRRVLLALGTIAVAFLPAPSDAQLSQLTRGGSGLAQNPVSRDQPVTFTADQVEYDRNNGIVTASGHVEAWQNGHVLRADKITFDRNTNVAAAAGHVTLVEPDGQVLFSDYAELTQGMRDAVLRGMRAILADNAKLAANGARRTEGKINEMSRAVYSTCNLCAQHPDRAPLWDLRARSVLQDTENKRIEYKDAVLDIYGIPVMYFPYFFHADPSVKRASGFLVPSLGESKHIGAFLGLPYYWAIDGQSDATITPTAGTEAGQVDVQYRRAFNQGKLSVGGAVAYDQSTIQGYFKANGLFDYNQTWRYGFNIDQASSRDYLRDFRIPGQADVLSSNAFAEGFGVGAYSRVDLYSFQAIATSVTQSALPYVLPRYEYSFSGEPDALGGRTTFDVQAFNVLRQIGTNTQRLGTRTQWDRPFAGDFGERYNVTLRLDAAGYVAHSLDQQPNFSPLNENNPLRAQPTAAVKVNWPFLRDGGAMGQQLIEPIVQLIAAPNAGRYFNPKIPNEDSFDFEFTDANLFSLNRYPGLDRQEGGLRANLGLHAAWFLNGTTFDGLVGQSYREHKEPGFLPLSGLNDNVSDVVARGSIIPADWLDLTTRARFDHRNFDVRFAEALASVGKPIFRVSGGFFHSATDPFFIGTQSGALPASYFVPRNELTMSASSHFGPWTFAASAQRNLQTDTMDSVGAHAVYEDECFIFDLNYYKRYTNFAGDHGDSTFLFQLTFKTVGQVGFNAL